ncbi:MAG TPA: deoxyhypusine synthase [Bdellovibrionales bacterium]|nr:deoxyhypusine synthase [Pseudobdellovibrionaceae bacterium]HAG90298.1 deoxyhypusine synthase [Bdellovibrionales bacterium]|tara:strand:+ start:623 stop:1588 length:966 start_codon:yes stop_codon:yes gene_type:complete
MGPISEFIESNYLHFNAAALKDAAKAYKAHIDSGGRMLVTLAGAMSTAELGITLAEMIRQDKIHGISCTGANLEEDVFNLVAHDHYVRVPEWRELTADQEMALLERHLNRVTDTCIPEEEAIRRIEKPILAAWEKASENKQSFFPHEYFYQILKSEDLKGSYQIDPKNSWMLAAAEKNLPIFVPGWEDSTLGNIFAGRMIEKKIDRSCLKSGVDYMVSLAEWYQGNENPKGIGFFQIGGGIAGDFPICVVPMLEQDLERNTPKWSYFCQISDSTTSYGSYSGAVPNEKITWGKLEKASQRHIIESDASIVAPLIFSYVLGR